MRYGPHTVHVEAFLEALADPAVRRSRRCRMADVQARPVVGHAVYTSVVAASRLEMWDAARMRAAEAAVPSQRHHAAGAALALVASDLLDDVTWRYYTDTPLARVVPLVRPGGPLAERCRCDVQVGQRLAAVSSERVLPPALLPDCDHTTSSLPTAGAVEIASGLVRSWEGPDWVELIKAARRLGEVTRPPCP